MATSERVRSIPAVGRLVCLAAGLAASVGITLSGGRPAGGASNEPARAPTSIVESSEPLPPEEAARQMRLPEGFHAILFAGEPDVVQPISFDIDPRGRLWVVECRSYPVFKGGPKASDRILIFEDADNDGRFDSRKVFWQGGTNVTSVALGFGGVWLCAAPNLLFIPDKNGDDRPDGEPEVVLDGWSEKAEHNFVNGLSWGPDGWLWGCNGILSNSKVGTPGTPDSGRVAMNCGVWRYHPTRKTFEVVAHGTTNPWGLDFDDLGQPFITNCVIPHLYRVVPGAHFQRMFGNDVGLDSYGLMGSCSDHLHWAGGNWTDSRGGLGRHGELGGGHAHVGAMIYLGDNWPERYRGTLFTCNLHGRRVNNDVFERRGSGYVAKHGRDFLFAADTWFRGIELLYGPDGAVYLSDWSDIGECHDTDADGAHRETGRIYKVVHGQTHPAKVDLASSSDEELARLQVHQNDWYVRTARRLLQERTASGRAMGRVHTTLRAMLAQESKVTRKLRLIWTLNVTGGLDGRSLRDLLSNESEYVRAWAVYLLCDSGPPSSETIEQFAAMARQERSAWVRLYLASALQRIAGGRRWGIVEGLIGHGEDAADSDLSLMIWYGLEPMVSADRTRAAALIPTCEIPLLRRYLVRHLVDADPAAGLKEILPLLSGNDQTAARRILLEGVEESLRLRKRVPMPTGWMEVAGDLARSPDAEVRERTQRLSLKFDAPGVSAALRALMNDRSADAGPRERALQALVDARVTGLAAELRALLDDRLVRAASIRGLAAFDDPTTPKAILDRYAELSPSERADAFGTLGARPDYALALLEAVGRGVVPRQDLSVTTVRQLLALNDPKVAARLEAVWGTLRPTSSAKAQLMAQYKALLTPDRLKSADPARGRSLFDRACAQCHRLHDAGGNIGPDLTGSDRARVDYVLENVLDPNAIVQHEYRVTTVATTDGRVISGLVVERSPSGLVLRTVTDRVVIPHEEIDVEKPSAQSLMPEGLLETLSEPQVLDLFAYLATPKQTPPAGNPHP
jgi:putative membrane-bound dehydrogenase-like protein